CGISDASVTSLTAELGRPVGITSVLDPVSRHLAAVLGAASFREVAWNQGASWGKNSVLPDALARSAPVTLASP
ncbi:MAG TPA: hypothetical protein VF843_09225, partial [Streptosporangiaceae bacterium]